MKFSRILMLCAAVFSFIPAAFAGNGLPQDEEFPNIAEALGQTQDARVEPSGENPFLRQWFDRISIGGFLNAGYVQTGEDEAQPNGHFNFAERRFGADLIIEGEAWKNVFGHLEFTVYDGAFTPNEMYVLFKDLLKSGRDSLFSLKVGQVNLPFGEEYLWQNAIDNPMVLRTVAWPWGPDKGILFFGKAGKLSWFGSVTDGSIQGDFDDSLDKCLALRVAFDPFRALHLSASVMENGKTAQSAAFFDEVNITPVMGSPSSQVDFQAYEGDAKIKIGRVVELQGDFGLVNINDVEPYNRILRYYYGQAKVNLASNIYVVGRYSAIGTFDGAKGYELGGDYDNANEIGSGQEFNVQSLQRVGAALGYKLNANTVWKVEYDYDWVKLIDGAPEDPGQRRGTAATEVVVKF